MRFPGHPSIKQKIEKPDRSLGLEMIIQTHIIYKIVCVSHNAHSFAKYDHHLFSADDPCILYERYIILIRG